MTSMPSFTVLLICVANVCRSPTAEALLAHELGPRKLSGVVDVVSRALRAPERMTRCEVSAKSLRAHGVETDVMLRSRPQTVDISDLESADIVLGSDQNVCAEIIRVAPRVRTRLFTLREGAALAASAASDLRAHQRGCGAVYGGDMSATGDPADDVRLRWLVAEMDARRGQVRMPAHHRGLSARWRRTASPYDIDDVHLGSARQHRAMIDETSAAVAAVAGRMAECVGVSAR